LATLTLFGSDCKVAVAGGRDFTDRSFLFNSLSRYHEKYGISWVTSGGATGADTYAEQWCKSEQIIGYTVYIAQWKTTGKKAGYRRNLLIVENSDIVIAFPTPDSKGTWHTISLAGKLRRPCLVCYSPVHWPGHKPYEVIENNAY